MKKDPSLGYVHQTLGWAYEQTERTSGKKGYLEKAEQEYRIALELNDADRFPDVESQLLLNLGNTYLALSNFREAYRHYRQREEQFTSTDETITELLYRKNYGEAAFKSGRTEESLVQYQLALRKVSPDQPTLRAEILERTGLSHQDLGQYAKAIEAFSQALALNRELGQEDTVTLLQRTIGVNLFNLSRASETGGREELKQALGSYFTSLDHLTKGGGKTLQKGPGYLRSCASHRRRGAIRAPAHALVDYHGRSRIAAAGVFRADVLDVAHRNQKICRAGEVLRRCL
jgi:tetratricopeptide (TPR) repeat protein